jgi:hypothetical protein
MYFFIRVGEMRLSDSTMVQQRTVESVSDYIKRFREVHNRCFSLNLINQQITEVIFQGLVAPIREKFSSQEFENLAQLAQRISDHES